MKKYLCILLTVFIASNVKGQTSILQYQGEYSSPSINGFVRDAVFAHDTCYFISGDGKSVLMKRIDGSNLINPFEGKIFYGARGLCINNLHLIVLDINKIRIYTKEGTLVREIEPVQNILYDYIWTKGFSEIMLASGSHVLIYNYSTGTFVEQKKATETFDESNFVNNGQRFIYGGYRKLYSYEYKNAATTETDITTPLYREYYDKDYHLSACINNQMFWFDYYKRDSLFVTDGAVQTKIASYPFFPISEKPTSDDIYTESGDPNLKIIPSQNAIYAIKISENKIKFYKLNI